MTPKRYHKKPVEVEAVQWDGSAEVQQQIVTWAGGKISGWFDTEYFLEVRDDSAILRVEADDWVVRGVQGEYYPVKPDVFRATYEPVEEPVFGSRRWRIWLFDAKHSAVVDGPETLPPPNGGLKACEDSPVEVMPVAEHEAYVEAVEQARRILGKQERQERDAQWEAALTHVEVVREVDGLTGLHGSLPSRILRAGAEVAKRVIGEGQVGLDSIQQIREALEQYEIGQTGEYKARLTAKGFQFLLDALEADDG
jgi:hypothetical protein